MSIHAASSSLLRALVRGTCTRLGARRVIHTCCCIRLQQLCNCAYIAAHARSAACFLLTTTAARLMKTRMLLYPVYIRHHRQLQSSSSLMIATALSTAFLPVKQRHQMKTASVTILAVAVLARLLNTTIRTVSAGMIQRQSLVPQNS